ncbi:MAG: hypothetical protein CL610_28105 [Anaerolineaceae bacterium]|nr:hypothetical protein [Anaerolineaceae bacterium]
MNDKPTPKSSNPQPNNVLRSPIRPQHPETASVEQKPLADPTITPNSRKEPVNGSPDSVLALDTLRKKMEDVAGEFAAGKINRTQFNAIYGRYDEQRMIIERIVERNPGSDAWKQVLRSGGQTAFLRDHFVARCLYFMVYRLNWATPLMMGGPRQPDMDDIEPVLATLFNKDQRPHTGLARKALGNGHWLVLAVGENALTIALYNLEPAKMQLSRVRDLHNDFERANRMTLLRGTRTLEKMVFPQRALVEET